MARPSSLAIIDGYDELGLFVVFQGARRAIALEPKAKNRHDEVRLKESTVP